MLKNRKGVTLAEMVLTIALLGIIMTPLTLVVMQGFNSYDVESNTVAAQEAARNIMNGIMEDLRENESNAVNVPNVNTLIIRNDLKYEYTGGKLLKNGVSVFEREHSTLHMEFSIRSQTEGFEGQIIDVKLDLTIGKGRAAELRNSYRRKLF